MSPVHNLNFVQQLSLKLRTLFGVGLNVINKNVIFLFCCFKNVYMSVIFVCLMLGLHLHQPFVLSLKPMSLTIMCLMLGFHLYQPFVSSLKPMSLTSMCLILGLY